MNDQKEEAKEIRFFPPDEKSPKFIYRPPDEQLIKNKKTKEILEDLWVL